MSIRERTINALCEITGSDSGGITDESNILMDLGADSLDLIEICMDLEEKFRIELPDDKIDAINTVGDLVALVTELVKERS